MWKSIAPRPASPASRELAPSAPSRSGSPCFTLSGGAGARRWATAVAALLWLLAPLAQGTESLERSAGKDRFAAGERVSFTGEVAGDALLAGSEVTLGGRVKGDALAAGGHVEVHGIIERDLYAAAGELHVAGVVMGNARLAAGHLVIEREASLLGSSSLVGGTVRVESPVEGYLQVAAGEVTLDSRVGGDAEIWAERLAVGPNALLGGRLLFHGSEPPDLAPGAIIAGDLQYIPTTEATGAPAAAALGAVALLSWLGAALLAASLLRLWPGFFGAVAHTGRHEPGRSALVGLGVAGGVPIAIGLCLVSLVGAPVGLGLLYVYIALFPLGHLCAALSVVQWARPRWLPSTRPSFARHFLAVAGVLLGFFALAAIPFLGGALAALITLAGTGALVLTAYERRRASAAAAAGEATGGAAEHWTSRTGSPSPS